MAQRLRRNYGDTEYREQYAGEEPKNGLHPVKLVSVSDHDTSETAMKWTFRICDGPFKGWVGSKYSDADGAKWVEQNILVALGLMKPGGSVNLTFDQILKKAKQALIRTYQEEWNDEWRAKIGAVLPDSDGGNPRSRRKDDDDEDETDVEELDELDDDEVDHEDETDVDEDEEAPAPRSRRSRKAAAPARSRRRRPEPEPEEDDSDEGDDDEDDEVDDEPPARSRRKPATRTGSRASSRSRSSRSSRRGSSEDPPF